MEKYKLDCRYFTGYKPCSPGKICVDCADHSPMGTRILIINLDALGDVLRTTAMLHPLKRKYSVSHITWVTEASAMPLLENNYFIDRVISYSAQNMLSLLSEKFDVLMNVDKSWRTGSIANLIDAKEKFGFSITENGAIYPFNKEAGPLYEIGLNDDMKFKINKKTEQELLCETMALEYKRDEYILNITPGEKEYIDNYKRDLVIKDGQVVIGFNTGCSNLYPYKKLPFENQVELLKKLYKAFPHDRIVLLGGREDTENNNALKKRLQNKVVSTPTDLGLRKGILFTDLCDIVISGDTLGLHMAVGLKKKIVAFFTISCDGEIDLYERGAVVLADIECRPCWKKACDREIKCYHKVDIDKICEEVKNIYPKVEKRT
ncbi:MAG: glycosyltransferase family 9 protein [Candidatus Omnitrophota bacterium]